MRKEIRFVTADEAVQAVKSGDHIHLSSVASAPKVLIEALCRRGEAGELKNVRIHHLHTEGQAPYTDPKFDGIFFHQGFFIGSNVRKSVQSGYSDYIPVLLSETQKLYRCGALPCDVAMIQVCPPDKHGFVSLGTSVDATLAAIECAKTVIAVVNRHVPRAWGQAMIPMDRIDIFVEDNIHTEMFADGVLSLVEKGVVNGSEKGIDKGKLVSTFVMGSQACYDFLDDNPMVSMMDVGYTNDPFNIAMNPKTTAINSALQVDLTGQVCADSLGTRFYSGAGGQMDFIYGASLSRGGKAIIAMPSSTRKGESKISPTLLSGAGVVTSRAHIHYLVTEYGVVDLYGKSLQERAKLIISIAHPDHREALDRAAFERFGPHYHHFGI